VAVIIEIEQGPAGNVVVVVNIEDYH